VLLTGRQRNTSSPRYQHITNISVDNDNDNQLSNDYIHAHTVSYRQHQSHHLPQPTSPTHSLSHQHQQRQRSNSPRPTPSQYLVATTNSHPAPPFDTHRPAPLPPTYHQTPLKMCYTLLSTCPTCTRTLHLRYTLCKHATAHSFSPAACPMRMKRRRKRCDGGGMCVRCKIVGEGRKGSLSEMPGRWKGLGGEDGRGEEDNTLDQKGGDIYDDEGEEDMSRLRKKHRTRRVAKMDG
jgi:hypothetical protein